MSIDHHSYADIRDAVRSLCAEFPGEYFRKIDEQRAYPEQFVDALTKAGWRRSSRRSTAARAWA
jgi:acyl-CoA dehydrogenase